MESDYEDDMFGGAEGGVANTWTRFVKRHKRRQDESFVDFIKRMKGLYHSKAKPKASAKPKARKPNPWLEFVARHKPHAGELRKDFLHRMSGLYHSGEKAPLRPKGRSYGTFD